MFVNKSYVFQSVQSLINLYYAIFMLGFSDTSDKKKALFECFVEWVKVADG